MEWPCMIDRMTNSFDALMIQQHVIKKNGFWTMGMSIVQWLKRVGKGKCEVAYLQQQQHHHHHHHQPVVELPRLLAPKNEQRT